MYREKALIFLLSFAAAPLARGGEAAALWSQKVQPMMDVQCTKCHGVLEQKSGLELDTVEKLLKGGDEGPVVIPGKPEESKLYIALGAGADPHMPPKKQVSDAERAAVKEWITALKEAPAVEIKKVTVPQGVTAIEDAVNYCLAEGWTAKGVKPAPEVDDR
ncbi:MAG TPA: c-type cytochrome domain-containing protein, partial [Verrucomicrobiales bacterium]|nr:c-type cytochrome domain-containing protein [Verrucomicrobiales bacterium]